MMRTAGLVTEAELAADFEITVERAAELRRRHAWPHVRLGRFDVRYTAEQVAAIVAMQSVAPKSQPVTGLAGQTKRSARRSA